VESLRQARADETPSRARTTRDDCRCRCGNLLARIVDEAVEIRCRRCKRTLRVPRSAREGWVQPVEAR